MKTPLQDVIKNSRLVVPVTYKLPKQPARSLPPPQLSILCWSKVAQPASGPRNVWFMSPSAVSLPVTRHIEMAEKVWNVSWDMHAALRWSFNETEIRSGYCSPTAHYPPPPLWLTSNQIHICSRTGSQPQVLATRMSIPDSSTTVDEQRPRLASDNKKVFRD